MTELHIAECPEHPGARPTISAGGVIVDGTFNRWCHVHCNESARCWSGPTAANAEAAAQAWNARLGAVERLETAERVPGHWRCPKCGFYNLRSTMTPDGRIGPPKPGSEGPSELLCPNDDVPMIAVTWQERVADLCGGLDDAFAERNLARSRLDRIERAGRALREHLDWCSRGGKVGEDGQRHMDEWDEAVKP